MESFYAIDADYLATTVTALFAAAGSPKEEAQLMGTQLVKANLTGHDSHGVIRVPQYLNDAREGKLAPGAKPKIIKENASTAVLSAEYGYGQVAAAEAMKEAIARAKKHGIAAVGITDIGHVGRLADYALQASKEDMIGLVFTGSGGFSARVAAFGGKDQKMSTNPIAAAFPGNGEHPIVFDFATSAYAEGKFKVMAAGNIQTPSGVLIDNAGQPTTNPHDLYNGGAILPVGGQQGHKGYLLNFLVEVLAGLLTGGGYMGKEGVTRFNNCTMMIAINVSQFRELPAFKQELDAFIGHLKDSAPIKSGEEVLYPGEKEMRTEKARREEGITLAENTLNALQAELDRYQIAEKLATHAKPAAMPVVAAVS